MDPSAHGVHRRFEMDPSAHGVHRRFEMDPSAHGVHRRFEIVYLEVCRRLLTVHSRYILE